MAWRRVMTGVKSFEDLDAWKLATALSDLIVRMTAEGKVVRDVKFVDQIRESAASAPSNISEGWSRFYPTENAQFVRWAKGSLGETNNHLLYGKRRKYFEPSDLEVAFSLCRRAIGATTRYLQYLESCDGEVPGQPPRHPKRRRGRDARLKRFDARGGKHPDPESRTTNLEPEPGTGNVEPEPGTGK
jgi:four helix bundle protein